MESLWPENISTIDVVAPVTILREQAKYLGEKTNNIIVGDVAPLHSSNLPTDYLTYGFYIEAPALSNYSYRLFTISHDPDPYPVTFHLDNDLHKEVAPGLGLVNDIVAESEEEFVKILAKVLQARKTQRIISSLLSQSTTFAPPAAEHNDNGDDIPF